MEIARLFIEPEQESRERLKIPEHNFIRESHYFEPGLQGVQKGIRYIKSLYKNDRETLPDYLKKEILEKFSVTIEVIWKMDEWKMDKNFEGNYDHIDSERDLITAISTSSEIKFFFSNNDNYMIYTSENYLEHLNTIQILDQFDSKNLDAIYRLITNKYVKSLNKQELTSVFDQLQKSLKTSKSISAKLSILKFFSSSSVLKAKGMFREEIIKSLPETDHNTIINFLRQGYIKHLKDDERVDLFNKLKLLYSIDESCRL